MQNTGEKDHRSYRKEIATVWIKYFTYHRPDKRITKLDNYDPLLAAITFIKDDDFEASTAKEIFQHYKDTTELLEELSQYFNFQSPISINCLELARLAVSTKYSKKHDQYLPIINTYVMRTFCKLCYNLDEEMGLLSAKHPMKHFPPIIFTYIKYFFKFFAITDSLFTDFQTISKMFYKTMSKYIKLLMVNTKDKSFIEGLFGTVPEIFMCICKEASTPFIDSLLFLKVFVNSYVDKYEEDYIEEIKLSNAFIISAVSDYDKYTEEKKVIIHQISGKILELFASPHEKNPELLLCGLNCLSLEIEYNKFALVNTIKSCIYFIKWITEEYTPSCIVFPDIEKDKRHFPNSAIIKKVNFVTVDEYKSGLKFDDRKEEPTALLAVKEISDIYKYITEMKELALKSPEVSLNLSTAVVEILLQMNKKPSLQVFLCIVVILIFDINMFCIKECLQGTWSAFFDENIFAIDLEDVESRPTKLFIDQMRKFIINFLITKCKNNKSQKITEDILIAVSNKIKTQNDLFFIYVLPFFQEMSYVQTAEFIPAFVSTGCHKTFIDVYKKNEMNALGDSVLRFLQVVSLLDPSTMFSDKDFMAFMFELLHVDARRDLIIKLISDALISYATLQASDQVAGLIGVIDFILNIFEMGEQNPDNQLYIDLEHTFLPVFTDFVKISKDKEVSNALSGKGCHLIAGFPLITNTIEDVKLMLRFFMETYSSFPSLVSGLGTRSSKTAVNMTKAIQSIDLDEEMMNILTSLLFGREAVFPEFGIIKNKEFITVYLNAVKGKPIEKEVFDFILFLVSKLRLNAKLCCESHCFQTCLSRLNSSKPEESELVKSILTLIMSLFEQFPSAHFLLQMVPSIKSGLTTKDSFWPHMVLKFLKKLSRAEDCEKDRYYLALYSSDSFLVGPTLPPTALNGEFTFATTVKILDLTPKGTPVPLFSAKADMYSSIQLMIKDNALVCTIISARSSFDLQQFPFAFHPEIWYFIEVFFSANDITFYCNKEKIGTVPRKPITFAGEIMLTCGTFNDPKIKKKALIDLRDVFLVNGNYVDSINTNTEITSIPSSDHICSFNVSSSRYNTMNVISPYGSTGKFIGYYLPPLIDFASLFEIDGVWNSFFVLFFSANKRGDVGSDNPIAILPKVMANIINKNEAAEAKFVEIDGFDIINQNFRKIEGNIDISIFDNYNKLFSAFRLEESKKGALLYIWMNAVTYKHVSIETAEFCINCVHKIAQEDEKLFSDVVSSPSIVDFFVQISTFNDTETPPFVVELMKDVIKSFTAYKTRPHFNVLLSLLLSNLKSDLLCLCLNLAEESLSAHNEVFIESFQIMGGTTPFITLTCNSNPAVHRLALRCLKIVSSNTNIVSEDDCISAILSITETLGQAHFDMKDIFLDSYDHMFAFYGTKRSIRNFIGNGREKDFSLNSQPITLTPAFFPLLAASSLYVDKTIVTTTLNQLASIMSAHQENCDGIQKIPYWPYWVIVLCQTCYSSSVALSKLSLFANFILYNASTSGNYEPVRKALSLIDVISHYLNINLLEEKKTILFSTFSSFPETMHTPEKFSGFVASVFSILFVRTITPFNNHITLKGNPFRVVMLDKAAQSIRNIPPESLKISVRLTPEGMWLDHDIASLTVELLSKWMINKECLDIIPGISLVTAFSYLLSMAMNLMPSSNEILSDKFLRSLDIDNNPATNTCDHRAIGIFVTFAKKNGLIEKDYVKKLIEKFNVYEDDEDSVELQKFMFEEELQANIRPIYLINFV